jgi:hypothetical protein
MLIEDVGGSRNKLHIGNNLTCLSPSEFKVSNLLHELHFFKVKIYRRTISIQLQVFQIGPDVLLLSPVEMQRKHITEATFTCPLNDAVKSH